MFCGKCGQQYDDSVKFCGNCGAPNPLAAVPSQPIVPDDPTPIQPVGGESNVTAGSSQVQDLGDTEKTVDITNAVSDTPNINGGDTSFAPNSQSFAPNNQAYGQNIDPQNQSFVPNSQGVDANSQGFAPNSQGFDQNSQGFAPNPRGYDSNPQGFAPNNQGFDQNPQGFAPNNQNYPPGATPPQDSNAGVKYALIGIVAFVAVVCAICAIVFGIFSGGGKGASSAKACVDGAVNALFKEYNVDKFSKYIPDEVWKSLEKEEGRSKKELLKELDDEFSQIKDYLPKDGMNLKVGDNEKITGDDLSDIQEEYDDKNINIKIQAAEKYTVEYTLSFMGQEFSDDMEMTAIKVKNRWYIDMSSMDSMM